MLKTLLISMLLFPFAVNATNYLSLHSKTDSKNTKSFDLSLLSSEDFSLQKTIESVATSKGIPEHGYSEDKSLFWVYSPGKNKKSAGQVTVYKTADLQIVSQFSIHAPELTSAPTPGSVVNRFYRLFRLSKDGQKFFAYVKEKKKKFLKIIDVKTGSVMLNQELGRSDAVVQTSFDDKYIVTHAIRYTKRKMYLIDANNAQVIKVKDLKQSDVYVSLDNTHLYLDLRILNRDGEKHRLSVYALSNGERITDHIESKYPFAFYNSKDVDFSILSYLHPKVTQGLEVRKINADSTIENLLETKEKIRPLNIHMNPRKDHVLINGKTRFLSFDMAQPQQFVDGRLGFDVAQIVLNKAGTRAYFREGSGSEVKVIDLQTGKTIRRTAIGRAGVKLGKFVASVGIAYVGLGFNYFIFVREYSNTIMILDSNEKHLFAINTKTNDVTSYNADDLSNRQAIKTGRITFAVVQGQSSENNNVIVLSSKSTTLINPETAEVKAQIEKENLVGIDIDSKIAFFANEGTLEAYSLEDASQLGTLSNFKPAIVYSLNSND